MRLGAANMIAVDVLIEPDAGTATKAKGVNARLSQDYPSGFPLDEHHVPHITVVQRFVRAEDLGALTAAVRKALQPGPAFPIRLSVTGYALSVRNDIGTLIYVVERSAELVQLESRLAAAIRPFAVSGGTADAFSRAPGEEITADTIRYVEEFVPASSGEKYFPHLTLGKARPEFLKSLEATPFEKFSFAGERV